MLVKAFPMPAAAPLFLLLMVYFAVASSLDNGKEMRRVFLDDEFSISVNARCLDGTRPAYYIRKSISSICELVNIQKTKTFFFYR